MTHGRATPASEHNAATSEATVSRLAAAVRIVSGLTLVSRFAGLARDVLVMRLLGDGALGSDFRAAYTIPNVFRRLFGEGALSAAFLPQYSMLRKSDPQRAEKLASVVVWACTLVTALITLIILAVLATRLAIFPSTQSAARSIKLIMLMLPMMPMVCLTAILGGVLQSHGKFGVPAAAPIVLNVFQIAAGAALALGLLRSVGTPGDELGMQVGVYVVGACALFASVLSVVWSLIALRGAAKLGSFSISRAWAKNDATTRGDAATVFSKFVPALLGLGTLQLNTMLDTVIAMWPNWVGPTMLGRPTPLDEASNIILGSTQTLYQFPLGVFGIAVATAVFPMLARTRDDPAGFVDVLRRGLRLSLFIGLPASVGLIVVRHDLIEVIYGSGSRSFSAEGIARCAAVLMGFAPAVWAYSLNHVFTRAFYALGDTTTPMKLACGSVVLNLVLNLTLIWHLREAGLAWATATSAMVQCVVLGVLLRRKLHRMQEGHERVLDQTTVRAFVRIACIAAFMGACVFGVQLGFGARQTWMQHALCLAACVGAGAIAYAGLSRVLGAPELRWLLTKAPKGSGAAEGMSLEG